jgi:hypothetical protein
MAVTAEWWVDWIHMISKIDLWHEQLPAPFNSILDRLLLNRIPYADEYLGCICILLCILVIIQTKALTRPPPVPLKILPKRPCLLIQFQPDDPVVVPSSTVQQQASSIQHMKGLNARTMMTPASSATTTNMSTRIMNSSLPNRKSFIQRIDGFMSQRLPFRNQNRTVQNTATLQQRTNETTYTSQNHHHHLPDHRGRATTTASNHQTLSEYQTPTHSRRTRTSMVGIVETVSDPEEFDDDWQNEYDVTNEELPTGTSEDNDYHNIFRTVETEHDEAAAAAAQSQSQHAQIPFVRTSSTILQDLPDSFAPLLSSSYMTMLTQQLTGDLIHAVQLEGEIRLRPGRHEVPLDKDTSRPQFVLDVSEQSHGCRISAVAVIGSDGLSIEQDMDVHRQTTSRSKPMVKHAGLVFDPPLPLSNVAPTLIHFPTLFEDRNMIPTLRSIQFVRYIVDFIVSISSFIEKCLWILEAQCQIHLSKVRITPIYKGQNKNSQKGTTTNDTNRPPTDQMYDQKLQSDPIIALTTKSPKWRLQLAFSGHVLIFGVIPIPFISIVLPSFIIPQPHALLEYLLSSYVFYVFCMRNFLYA